jgi:hypothetical protein
MFFVLSDDFKKPHLAGINLGSSHIILFKEIQEIPQCRALNSCFYKIPIFLKLYYFVNNPKTFFNFFVYEV